MAPVLAKSLSRLSRDSLIDLCLRWTDSQYSTPYLTTNRRLLESEEEDYLYEPTEDRDKLRQYYQNLKADGPHTDKDTLSKRDIIDRIVDGDWRRGLSLHQHATIDFAHLEENDASLRWTASKLVPLAYDSVKVASSHPAKKKRKLCQPSTQSHYPTIDPTIFITNLKAQISPLVKAHYSLHRLSAPSRLTILRLYIVPSAAFSPSHSTIPTLPKEATDAARVMYIALPDSCPYIYVSLAGSIAPQSLVSNQTSSKFKIDMTTTKRIILEAIPKALSRPQERWSLESTKLTARSLKSMSLLRGNGRPGTSGGAYAQFSEEYDPSLKGEEDKPSEIPPKAESVTSVESRPQPKDSKPLQMPHMVQCMTPPPEDISELEIRVNRRFGNTSGASHATLDRLHVKVSNIRAAGAYTQGKGSEVVDKMKGPRATRLTKTSNKGSKRKRLSLDEIEQGQLASRQQGATQSPSQQQQHQLASISITFSGTDVFAGLKQLALLGDEYIDLDRMPGWMTGERGVSGLVI